MDINELEVIMTEANQKKYEVEHRYHDRQYQLRREADDKALAEFSDELKAVREAAIKADREWTAERDRLALAEAKLPYPEGTVMVKWESPRWGSLGNKMKLTKQRGVIQLFRAGDPYVGKWGVPFVGNVVIRHLLKNGKPGAYLTQWYANNGRWLPEGVKHPLNKE